MLTNTVILITDQWNCRRGRMMTMLEKYIEAVEKNKALILETERWLWAHPEIGYKEWKSSDQIR